MTLVGVNDTSGMVEMYDQTDSFPPVSFTGGNVNVGTSNDSDFVDADANNLKATFNASKEGRYLVKAIFTLSNLASLGLSMTSDTLFRLTDGTNHSSPVSIGGVLSGVLGIASGMKVPVTVEHVFDYNTSGSVTIKLQKRNISSVNISTREVLANSTVPFTLSAIRILN